MKRVLVGLVVAALVLGAAYLVVARREVDALQGLAPVGSQPFGDGDTIDGVVRGLYSDDGGRLAVITADGLGLAEQGTIRRVTREGSNVVDAAWFGNGATLLVAEGPVPTGGLAVVDLDGRVRGTVPLRPSVGFGAGHGMSVAPGGRSAVVTAVDRPVLGPEVRHLVLVDLETGATKALTTPDGPDEHRPFHLDATRVAYTESPPAGGSGRPRALAIDTVDGTVTELDVSATVAGVIDGAPVLQRARRLSTTGPGARTLVTLPSGVAVSSVRPDGAEVVVAATVDTPEGGRTGRLRRIPLERRPSD